MDDEKYIRGLSDYELNRLVNIDADRYTKQELAVAYDEIARRKTAARPVVHSRSKIVNYSTQETVTCGNCGREVPQRYTYCPDCGEMMARLTKREKKLIGLAIFIAVLIMGGVCWLMVQIK